jgi:ATP-binding cassette, subfamily B, multidrug efflux pump
MRLLARYMKPYLAAVAAVMALVLARAMSELALPRIMGFIVDGGIAAGNVAYILRLGLFMLAINLVGMACAFGSSYLSAKVSVSVGAALRRDLFAKASALAPADMDRFGASSLITRITNDAGQVQNLAMMSLRLMLMAPLMMVGGIIMAVSQDARLSSILVVALPVLALLVAAFGRKGMPLFKAIQEKTDGLNRVVRENLSGLRVIRAFNRREREEARFGAASRDLADTTVRVAKLMALLMPLIMFLLNLAIVVVLWFGARRVDLGSMRIGSLMAFVQYLGQILSSLLMVSMLFIMIPRASVSLGRLRELLDAEETIRDDEKPVSIGEALSGGLRLEFDEVSMRYHGAEASALEGISFSCEPGKLIAVIGGTGSGKSSLLKLALRFHDPEAGALRLGGVDLRRIRQAELRSIIGYVPQKSFLFSKSVTKNVGYGSPGADAARIREALEAAQAQSFVEAMAGGADAELARGGTTVSGGQRQRLAIARALARRPLMYLFDDSFSALDTSTEAALREALKAYTRDAIVIMVTQRVRSAKSADLIVVLDEGRMAGLGSHEELAAGNAVYRELLGSQAEEGLRHER